MPNPQNSHVQFTKNTKRKYSTQHIFQIAHKHASWLIGGTEDV
uniref:Uncharacterized protein n=1 Tax=Anguilla anguilla TaxID=7936 RepID=A0A0E9P9Z0_ANGAN